MATIERLRKSFTERAWRVPFTPLPALQRQGLVLGHGTLLARMGAAHAGEEKLMLAADEARLLVLLCAVYGRQASPRVMSHVARASDHWARGDKALANIALAYAQLPRLESREDSFRLFLAEDLLARGMTPRRLARALGFDPKLLKYDPAEARESAGHGRASGRWVRVDGGDAPAGSSATSSRSPDPAGTAAAAAPAIVAAAGTALIETAERSVLEWLAAYAWEVGGLVGAGVAVVAGVLLISTRHSPDTVEGAVPTLPGVRYKFSKPTGELTITVTADDGEAVTLNAQRQGHRGIYYDAKGRPLGREIGSGLYVDLDSIEAGLREKVDAPAEPSPQGARQAKPFLLPKSNEPKLCPDPSRDRGKKKDQASDKNDRDFNNLY